MFVGKDNTGKAKFACMRGITGNLKKDVYGSDKEFSFCYPPQNPGSRHVAVLRLPLTPFPMPRCKSSKAGNGMATAYPWEAPPMWL